jgi:hypothetical protein
MKRPEIENLNHQQNGHNLNVFQKADAIIEFHKLIKYIEHLESEVQKDLIADVGETFYCYNKNTSTSECKIQCVDCYCIEDNGLQ